jgi:hypothetical protein
VNGDVHIIPVFETQGPQPTPRCEPKNQVFASNLKRASFLGPILGSLDLFIPAPESLHIHCIWQRNERGHERILLPRVKLETPHGAIHHKTLMRWNSAAADHWFQASALHALHALISREKSR